MSKKMKLGERQWGQNCQNEAKIVLIEKGTAGTKSLETTGLRGEAGLWIQRSHKLTLLFKNHHHHLSVCPACRVRCLTVQIMPCLTLSIYAVRGRLLALRLVRIVRPCF